VLGRGGVGEVALEVDGKTSRLRNQMQSEGPFPAFFEDAAVNPLNAAVALRPTSRKEDAFGAQPIHGVAALSGLELPSAGRLRFKEARTAPRSLLLLISPRYP